MKAGFTVEFLTTIFWLLPLPIFPFRSLPSRMGIRRNKALGNARAEYLTSTSPLRALAERLQVVETLAIRSRRMFLLGSSLLVWASKETT